MPLAPCHYTETHILKVLACDPGFTTLPFKEQRDTANKLVKKGLAKTELLMPEGASRRVRMWRITANGRFAYKMTQG